MNIGLLKEIKAFEHRVMLTPDAVEKLVQVGNSVFVESSAGQDSGFADKEYESVGARILPTSERVFKEVELILQVQPPMPIEYELFNDSHISISFLHAHNSRERIQALLKSNAIYFSAALIPPINNAMNEIKGKVAINQAIKYLERNFGGKGILFSGACGEVGAAVTILGSSTAGQAAARQALALDARVNLIDVTYDNLLEFKNSNPSDLLNIYEYDKRLMADILMETDVLIAAVQQPGQKSKMHVVKEELKLLEKGSLVIDLSINQGDCIENSRETKHDDPVYVQNDILFYSVSDLPSVVARTSSQVLSNVILQYIEKLSQTGFAEAIATNPEIRKSLLLYRGKIVSSLITDSPDTQHYDILELIESNV
jgi:alanine dehydrogenase